MSPILEWIWSSKFCHTRILSEKIEVKEKFAECSIEAKERSVGEEKNIKTSNHIRKLTIKAFNCVGTKKYDWKYSEFSSLKKNREMRNAWFSQVFAFQT